MFIMQGVKLMSSYSTINTFHQAPSPAQIVAYILFISQIALFYAVIQRRLESPTSFLVLHIVYGIAIFGQLVFTFICSIVDPSDPIMVSYRTDGKQIQIEHQDEFLYCDVCKSYVQKSARHCRICCRCVEKFDHHCIWINNCVGGLNYRSFIGMILFTLMSMTVFLASMGVLWAEGNFKDFIGQMVVVWIVSFFVCIFDFLVFNLILLHAYLAIVGTTTYDLIMQNRQKKRLQEMEKKRNETRETIEEENNKTVQKEQGQKKQRSNQSAKQKNPQFIYIFEENDRDNQHNNELNNTENNILEKKQGFDADEFDHKSLRETRVHRKKNEMEEDEMRDSTSSQASIKIGQFFARNKSLKILVSGQAEKPKVFPTSYASKNNQMKRHETAPIQIAFK